MQKKNFLKPIFLNNKKNKYKVNISRIFEKNIIFKAYFFFNIKKNIKSISQEYLEKKKNNFKAYFLLIFFLQKIFSDIIDLKIYIFYKIGYFNSVCS